MAADITVVNATTERVHLVISNPDGYNIGKVMRVDSNGTRTVRTLTGQLPSTAAVIDLYDYEYALASDHAIVWHLYNTAGAALSLTSLGLFGGVSRHALLIACPLYPSNGITLSPADSDDTLAPTVSFAIAWNSTRAGQSKLHAIIGRSDPAVVLRPAATRAGDLTLICPDHVTCERIEAQLSLPQIFMLRQADVVGLDAYFVVTSTTAANVEGTKRWQLVVGMTEIAWPAGSYVPVNVWTYADVLTQHGDYNHVAASYSTYARLLDRMPNP